MESRECMHEVAELYGDTKEMVRGGLKTSLEKAIAWAEENNRQHDEDPFVTFIVVEADENAITEEEYWKEYNNDAE